MEFGKDRFKSLSNVHVMNCLHCNDTMYLYKYEVSTRKFCSRECKTFSGKKIRESYRRDCLHCGRSFVPIKANVDVGCGKYCSRKCNLDAIRHLALTPEVLKRRGETLSKNYKPRFGEENPFWKGGITNAGDGYKWIRYAPYKTMLLHRFIMQQHLGRTLEVTELVHHKNGDNTDNKIENLELVSRAEHINIHREQLYTTRRKQAGTIKLLMED